jgi:hypothetical protein
MWCGGFGRQAHLGPHRAQIDVGDVSRLVGGGPGLRQDWLASAVPANGSKSRATPGAQIYIEASRIYLGTPGLTPAHTELMTNTVTPPLT